MKEWVLIFALVTTDGRYVENTNFNTYESVTQCQSAGKALSSYYGGAKEFAFDCIEQTKR